MDIKVIFFILFLHISVSILAQNNKGINLQHANECLMLAYENQLIKRDFNSSLQNFKEASDIYKTIYGANNKHYLETIYGMAETYELQRDYVNSIAYFLLYSTFSTDSNSLLRVYRRVGQLYQEIGDYANAAKYYNNGIFLFQEGKENWSSNVSNCYEGVSFAYDSMGDYASSLNVIKKYLAYIEKYDGKNSIKYISNLSHMAQVLAIIGDNDRALRLCESCLLLLEEISSYYNIEESNECAVLYSVMASVFRDLNEYDTAITLYTKSLVILEKTKGIKNIEYARVLNNIGLAYFEKEKIGDAINYLIRAAMIIKENYGHDCLDFAITAANIGDMMLSNGEFTSAQKFLNMAIELFAQNMGNNNIGYIHCLNSLAMIDANIGNYASSEKRMREILSCIRKNIRASFIYFNENERKSYWENFQRIIFNIFDLATEKKGKQTTELIYDTALLSKGLLLNTNRSLKQIVQDSGNKTLLEGFNELQHIHYNISLLRSEFDKKNNAVIDSLERQADKIELSMQTLSMEYGNFANSYETKWSDVQRELSKEDTAIEIINYEHGTDMLYDAIVIRKSWKSPKLVHLFSSTELNLTNVECSSSSIYDNPQLFSNYIWKPLLPFLKDSKRVFFSPSGILYNIGIEYLMLECGKRICDLYQVVRLSSTRELLRKDDNGVISTCAIYGGLNYNADIDEMMLYSEMYSVNHCFRSTLPHNFIYKNPMMWGYLKGSKREVEQVANVLSKGEYDTNLIIGSAGVEESFKSLSGKKIGIIHIATHGFYFPMFRNKTNNTRDNMQSTLYRMKHTDLSLLFSGLLFSGANNAWNSDSGKLESDDGILTALEVSSLDLRSADLVVLSACQTGLGEISEDGVWGLQRAFKMAGVKTLLMSLWEINDEATQVMMVNFYEHLMDGKTKHESLYLAQEYLKKQKFNVGGKIQYGSDPHIWASFVLMD